MPLQHQEHETGHDRRLQSTVARIVTITRDVLKWHRRCLQIGKSVKGPLWGMNSCPRRKGEQALKVSKAVVWPQAAAVWGYFGDDHLRFCVRLS